MEHAFGVLQVCFHIIVNPFWLWDQKIILDILMANMLIQNMILEDKCNEDLNNFELGRDIQISCKLYFKHIENTIFNYQLKNDLIEHLWALKGNKHTWNYFLKIQLFLSECSICFFPSLVHQVYHVISFKMFHSPLMVIPQVVKFGVFISYSCCYKWNWSKWNHHYYRWKVQQTLKVCTSIDSITFHYKL